MSHLHTHNTNKTVPEVDPQGTPLMVVASNAAADEGFKAAGAGW